MKKLLCPSMMCARFGHLEKEIHLLEEADIDIFHIDLMDGSFVPNFGMGLQDIEFICQHAKKPCDIHLMVNDPIRYIKKFVELGCKIIYIHPKSDMHPCSTLQKIRELGAYSGIVIDPDTTFESVQYLLSLCDYVLIMTVNPGFAGQKYLNFVTPKIIEFVDMAHQYGDYLIMIDGACSFDKIKELSKVGVHGFVLGTSVLFNQEESYSSIISKLRN